MCADILKAMDTEPEKDVLAEQLAALAKCIEGLGNGCLTEEMMAELIKILDRLLKEHFQRFTERQVKIFDLPYFLLQCIFNQYFFFLFIGKTEGRRLRRSGRGATN